MTSNEYYFGSQSRKIVEKMNLEKVEQVENARKRKNTQLEVVTEDWVRQFVKPEYRLSFMSVL